MAGLSERCRSAARDGARGPGGWEVWEVWPGDPPVARAVGERTENSEPRNNVAGYTARMTAEGAGRAGVVIVVVLKRPGSSEAHWANF